MKRVLARVKVAIVKRPDHAKGFLTLSKRCRRLATDWECLNRKAVAFLRLASIRLVLRKPCNPA